MTEHKAASASFETNAKGCALNAMTCQTVSAEGYLTTVNVIFWHSSSACMKKSLFTQFIYLSHTPSQVLLRTFKVPVDQVLLVHIVQSLKRSPQDLSPSLPYEFCSCGEYTVGLLRLLQLQDVVVDATPHLADRSREILCIQREREVKGQTKRNNVLK